MSLVLNGSLIPFVFFKVYFELLIILKQLPYSIIYEIDTLYIFFHSQQWLFDKQDLMRERQPDLKILNSEEDYHKILIFFANCMSFIYLFLP